MKKEILFKIAAWAVLLTFTFLSCSAPSLPDVGPNTLSFKERVKSLPLGAGDARFFYLNSGLQPSDTDDAGITAFYVENNALTSKILVLSDIPDPAGGNTVRIINAENNSTVTFHYYRNKNFPYKMVINKDGREAVGLFSMYNQTYQKYSVSFRGEGEGDAVVFNDFTLNRAVLDLYRDNVDLNASQNTRIRHIIVTLGLWESLALQMPEDASQGPALSFWSDIRGFVGDVLRTVSVIATIVAIVAISPVSLIIGQELSISTYAIAVGVSYAASYLADLIDPIPVERASPEVSPPEPYVMIRRAGQVLENNALPPLYLEHEEEVVFEVQWFVESIPVAVNKFDPNHFQTTEFSGNNTYFDISQSPNEGETALLVTVKRNLETGINLDGRMQVIFDFERDLRINNSSLGVLFQSSAGSSPVNRNDIFIVNFTVAH